MAGDFEHRSNYAVGIFFVVLGGALLSERLGLIFIEAPFWLALGISVLYLGVSTLIHRPSSLGGIVTAIGLLLTTNALGLTHVSFSTLWRLAWPVALILAGLWLIGSWGAKGAQGRQVLNVVGDYDETEEQQAELGDRTVWSLIGDVRLDLSRCRVRDGVTYLRIHSVIGDVDLTLPEDVAVDVYTTTLLGDTYLFHQHHDGILQSARHRSDMFDEHPKKLRIYVRSLIGDIDVQSGLDRL